MSGRGGSKSRNSSELRQQTLVESFCAVAKVAYGIHPAKMRAVPPPAHGANPFDRLCDDALLSIYRSLLPIPKGVEGAAYWNNITVSRKAALHLVLSCRRVAELVGRLAAREQAEFIARGSTTIFPASPYDDFAFTLQICAELRSGEQYEMLKQAQLNLACHCAGPCCSRLQAAFNRDLKNGKVLPIPTSPRLRPVCRANHRVVPVLKNCHLLACTPSGKHVVAYARTKLTKPNGHGETRSKRFEDVLISLRKQVPTNTDKPPTYTQVKHVLIDTETMSRPVALRIADGGSAAVYVCTVHDTDQDEPFSAALLWKPDEGVLCRVPPPQSQGAGHDLRNVQAAWFTSTTDDGGPLLVVAWSSDFVHPTGTVIGTHTTRPGDACACFATYTIDGSVPELMEVTSHCLLGQLLECHPIEDGRKVVCLFSKWSFSYSKNASYVYVHDLASDRYVLVPSASGTLDRVGPLTVAASATGDCIASLNNIRCPGYGRNRMRLLLNICVRSGDTSYVCMSSVDVTSYISQPCNHNGRPEIDAGSSVGLGFEMLFSPCGRYLSIVDQHPRWGEMPRGYGVVTVDTAMRMVPDSTARLRACPMFTTDDQAPRAMHWTRDGIWLLPPGTDEVGTIGARGGALCLHASDSFALS